MIQEGVRAMADIVPADVRSRMMSGIRGKNTRIEVTIRKALFSQGFRYRLHSIDLPGKPDIVLPKYHAVIFVHGCFWHGHDCELFRLPKTNPAFWEAKINRNRVVDQRNAQGLLQTGWRVLTVWECAVRGQRQLGLEKVVALTGKWLNSSRAIGDIRSRA